MPKFDIIIDCDDPLNAVALYEEIEDAQSAEEDNADGALLIVKREYATAQEAEEAVEEMLEGIADETGLEADVLSVTLSTDEED